MKQQALGEQDGATFSDNSLKGILNSILGGSSNRSDIGSSRSEGSFGGYGDDFALESTDSEQHKEEKPPVGGREEGGFADHATGSGDNADDSPRMKRPDPTANKERALTPGAPGALCGSLREKAQRRSAESTYQGGESGSVGVGTSEDNSNSSSKQRNNSNDNGNVVSGNSANNDDDHGHDGRDDDCISNSDNNDGDNGSGTEDEKDQPIDKFHRCNEAKAPRWPTRQSVESSSGYIFYARIAGDYPEGTVEGPRKPRGQRRRRRRALRRQTDGGGRQQACRSQSPRKHQSKSGVPDEVGVEDADDKTGSRKEKQSSSHKRRSPGRKAAATAENGTFRATRGDGSVGCSSGLSILEGDVRGAMVAVWLAWGVRIDAAREEQRREERWLEAVHRAERAKVAYVWSYIWACSSSYWWGG